MEEQGTCINFIASTFANGFVNIVVDTVMVIMPVYEVSRLNLSVQKKIGVAVMLGMGLVYVFPSFVPCFGIHAYTYLQIDDHWNRPRRHFLPKHLQHKPNLCVSSKYPPSPLPLTKVAVEMEPLNHWSVIECQIAIICACLPTSRALFVRVLPGANTTHDSSTARPYPTATGASSRTAAVSAFAGSGEREKGRIAKTVSYSVDIGSKTKRLTRESDGFIQLKDIEAGGERG